MNAKVFSLFCLIETPHDVCETEKQKNVSAGLKDRNEHRNTS
jgi:hypothetical protein